MLIWMGRQIFRQVNIYVGTHLAFCDNQHEARCCQNRQCIIILFYLAYGGSNLQKCFTWGMCSLRARHIPCCQHLSYCADWLQTFHFSRMSRNVTPDISTKKAISANQMAQVDEINGILLEEKVQSHICSILKLHSPDSLARSSIASALPLGKLTIFLFWPRSKSWAGASRGQIGNIYLGLKRDWAQTFRVILNLW